MMSKQLLLVKRKQSILIVEDQEERIHWFRKKLAGLDVTVAMSPQRALNLLGVHKFDVVFLDHDAVPEIIKEDDPDHDNKTFFRVAQLLAKQEFSGGVLIHSFNIDGARRMEHLLGRHAKVIRIPFGMFNLEVID
jgi:CheY-like chemotaxis protein